jgi:hypothetical protein
VTVPTEVIAQPIRELRSEQHSVLRRRRYSSKIIAILRSEMPAMTRRCDYHCRFPKDPKRWIMVSRVPCQNFALSATSSSCCLPPVGGVAVGMSLADAERLNGKPFKVIDVGQRAPRAWTRTGWAAVLQPCPVDVFNRFRDLPGGV